MSRQKAYDFVVVGGGTAGCVVASRLAASGERSVVLLEAGPDLRGTTSPEQRDGRRLPTIPDWGFESEPDAAGSTRALRRARLLGGTSWLTRFAVRGAAEDFDAWAARGNPGWAFEDVLPAFRRIEADAEFGERPWHGPDGPVPITRYPDETRSGVHAAAVAAFVTAGVRAIDDHNEPGAIGVGPLPMSSSAGRRVTSVDAFLSVHSLEPRPTILADSLVSRVLLEGGRAIGVELADGRRLDAGSVILSAGTYGSPTILLRSGVGPSDRLREVGIGVRHELPGVGENLADHPGVDLDLGWSRLGVEGALLHSIATVRSSVAPLDGPPDLMFWISDPDPDDPGFWLDPILLKPESRGSVRLGSADPATPPRITLPGIQTTRDRARLIEGYRMAVDVADQAGLRPFIKGVPTLPRSAQDWRTRVDENAYSLPHVVGTCAMGPPDDAGAVVDALGRVHSIEGLSVIDASIIPEPPSGFPHLITIMLADHLSRVLSGQDATSTSGPGASQASRAKACRRRADR